MAIFRTKRNFDGTASPGKKIEDLLPQILTALSPRGDEESKQVFAFWFQILGDKMGPLTQPVSWKNGVLTIKVKSATLYSLLSLHEKSRLLKQLKEKFPIRDLQFRVG